MTARQRLTGPHPAQKRNEEPSSSRTRSSEAAFRADPLWGDREVASRTAGIATPFTDSGDPGVLRGQAMASVKSWRRSCSGKEPNQRFTSTPPTVNTPMGWEVTSKAANTDWSSSSIQRVAPEVRNPRAADAVFSWVEAQATAITSTSPANSPAT